VCERLLITAVVVGKMFGPIHFTRHDLAVMSIMRGRDHGVLDYNSARVAYGLPAVTDWRQINPWLDAVNPDVGFEFDCRNIKLESYVWRCQASRICQTAKEWGGVGRGGDTDHGRGGSSYGRTDL